MSIKSGLTLLIASASLFCNACTTDDDVPEECAQYPKTQQAYVDFYKAATKKDANFTCTDYIFHSLVIAAAINTDIPDFHDEDDPRIKELDACAGPWAMDAGISKKNYNKHSVELTRCLNTLGK